MLAHETGALGMPRFFIHVRKPDGSVTRDYEGETFRNLRTAEAEATETIRELRQHFTTLTTREWIIDISDAKQRVLASIPFANGPD